MANRYYSIMRPIGIGTFPPGAHVTNIVNFHERKYVPEIGREAWGYIEFSHTLSKKYQIAYELLPGGGMSERQFRSQFAGVLTENELNRLSAYAIHRYKKAHNVTKVSESDRAIARLELMQYLFSLVSEPSCIDDLVTFNKALRTNIDVHAFGERLVDLKDSTMVE
jgi:hypothetical protein